MVDTPRTLAALQTLLADNVTEEISPQDVRDFLVSVYPQFSDWTPNVFGASTDPNLGDAPEQWGRYTRQGALISGWGFVSPGGSGIAGGTGNIQFDLPVEASLGGFAGTSVYGGTHFGMAGWGEVLNAGSSFFIGPLVLVSTTRAEFKLGQSATPGYDASLFNADGDVVWLQYHYEA